MAAHARISIDAGVEIYFCDPHSPWQRGSNENTNGLLRQYFPKGTDLSVHSAAYLDEVAAELNEPAPETLRLGQPHRRPRPTTTRHQRQYPLLQTNLETTAEIPPSIARSTPSLHTQSRSAH